MAIILPQGKQQYTNNAGAPLVGGRLYTFAAGSSTPKVTFADAAGLVPNTNPVPLDARGEAIIYWDGLYKVELRDAADNLIWTVDDIGSSVEAAATGPYDPTVNYVVGTIGYQFNLKINVVAFGADKTGVADSLAGFQAAVAFASLVAYGPSFNTIGSVASTPGSAWPSLVIPRGSYGVSGTVRIPIPMNIEGDGDTAVKIFARPGFVPTSNNAIVDISRADGHWILSQKISGFSVIDGTKTRVPLYGRFLHQWSIEDVSCCGGSIGIHLEGSYSGKIGRIGLYGNVVGGRINGLFTPSTQEANDIHVERVEANDNDIGLEVGGSLSLYIKGVIQNTRFEAVKVIDNIQLLDLSGLYVEDWFNSLPEYNANAYAITTPLAGSGKMVGKLIMRDGASVGNRPVIRLDQCIDAVIVDNYMHNSGICVRVLATAATKSLEYKRNYLKRSGGAAAPGLAPQEFFNYILLNESPTLRPELLASDFITGNSTDPLNINWIFGFFGQISQAKCGKLIVDTLVPFPMRYSAGMTTLKCIEGRGPETGFSSAAPHFFFEVDGLVLRNFKLLSSNTINDGTTGDTAAGTYVGGTFNSATGVIIEGVVFENSAGARAVEFGRLLDGAHVTNCKAVTSSATKGAVFSKDSFYHGLTSNAPTTGTFDTNVQTATNFFFNCNGIGAANLRGLQLSRETGIGVAAAIETIPSAATIDPGQAVAFVSGTVAINTITPWAGIADGTRITLIPTGAWSVTTAGNIQRAVSATAGVPLDFIWDRTLNKWWVK